MNSFLRLLTLGVFAAAGVGFAIYVATSLDIEQLPEAAAQLGSAPVWSPESSPEAVGQGMGAGGLASAVPQVTAPQPAYAQQIPPDPPMPNPPSDGADLGQLGKIGQAILDEVTAQEARQDAKDPAAKALAAAAAKAAASAAAAKTAAGEDEEGEDEGDPTGTNAVMQTRKGTSTLPSSLKISKLPGEGDDRLSVHIQNKDLREVLDFLGEQGGLSILSSNSVQGTVSVSLTDVTIDEALSAILKSTGYVARREGKFIYVGTPKDILAMSQSIDRVGTRVYRPNYVKAAELQPLIMPLLSPAGTANAATSATAAVAVSPPAQLGIAADGAQTGGDTFAQGEVLVVRDYEAVLAEIDQVIAEIDKRPLQVSIEAMLLSVELKDTNSFGVDFQFLRDKQHVLMATGSPLQTLGDVSFTDGGLKLGFLDSSLGAFLAALQTIGDTNVIATPRLMCLNKHKAEILIGQQLGYVTKTLTQTTTAQTVEFLEVGTQLRLRPFISTDGLIRMEVHPELSTGTVEVIEGFTLPNKTVTQVTTNIMVRDGCTVVIGGLMQESLANTGSQVPLLGSAPGIGWLFRTRKGSQTRDEIIVLITPHIVYEPESCLEGDKAAAEFHRQHAVYKDELNPLNSRYLGRKFFRLAQNAWGKNDKKAAMRLINMSIHFDPQSRAAISLRSDIMANNHDGDQTGLRPFAAVPTEAIDGEQIAPWVLDDLEHGAVPDDGHPHPRDPGAPTARCGSSQGDNFDEIPRAGHTDGGRAGGGVQFGMRNDPQPDRQQ